MAGSVWLGATIDPQELSANVADLPEAVKQLLEAGDYKAVIEKGFNVLTFDPLEHIAVQDLVGAAIERYADKYGQIRSQ